MEELKKYQLAWKTENSFSEVKLTDTEIQSFMNSTSKVVVQYKRSIGFDIIFKFILIVSFLVLMVFLKNQSIFVITIPLLILIAIIGIIWQIKVNKALNTISFKNNLLKDLLQSQINFYKKIYVKSILVSAFSSSLLFISGSLFYMHIKYKQIPTFEIDDIIVLSLGIILSYVFSSYAQLRQNRFQISQLESCLVEIEDNTINTSTLKKYKFNSLRNKILIGVLLITGLVLFFYLIFGLNS